MSIYNELFEYEENPQRKNVPAIRKELHDIIYKLNTWKDNYPGEKAGLEKALNYIIVTLSLVYEYEYFSRLLNGHHTKRDIKFMDKSKKELIGEAQRVSMALKKPEFSFDFDVEEAV